MPNRLKYKLREKCSCIYKITCKTSNRVYIGSAKNFYKRMCEHYSAFRRNMHGNIKLQRAYNKYGESNLKFEIIERVHNVDDLIKREQFYLDTLLPKFNIKLIANSALGVKRSKLTCYKISRALIGKKLSQEHKDAIKKPILQFNKDGKLIKIWKSTTDASIELGIGRRNIGNVLKSRSNTAGGFIWKYIHE